MALAVLICIRTRLRLGGVRILGVSNCIHDLPLVMRLKVCCLSKRLALDY